MQAIQAINALTHEWASNPEAATMLRSLAYHRCLLEGLVQVCPCQKEVSFPVMWICDYSKILL